MFHSLDGLSKFDTWLDAGKKLAQRNRCLNWRGKLLAGFQTSAVEQRGRLGDACMIEGNGMEISHRINPHHTYSCCTCSVKSPPGVRVAGWQGLVVSSATAFVAPCCVRQILPLHQYGFVFDQASRWRLDLAGRASFDSCKSLVLRQWRSVWMHWEFPGSAGSKLLLGTGTRRSTIAISEHNADSRAS